MARSTAYREKIMDLHKSGKLKGFYVNNPSGKSSDYRLHGTYKDKSVFVKGSGVYQKAYHKIRDIDEGLK